MKHPLTGRGGDATGFETVKMADGTVLAVLERGPEDAAATVILIHGWTQDHTSWEDVAVLLAEEHRVLSYDARGHGRSDAGPKGSGTVEQLADDLVELIGQLVPTGPVVLAGHSLGGPILLALAERHPDLMHERVAGLALVATLAGKVGKGFLGLPDPVTRAVVPVADLIGRLHGLSPANRNTRYPRVIQEAIRIGLYGPQQATEENRRRTSLQVARAHPETTAVLMRQLISDDRTHLLSALSDTPTVVLAGEKDALTPVAYSEAIAAALPTARLVVYPNAGHMLPYERAEEVAAEISALVP